MLLLQQLKDDLCEVVSEMETLDSGDDGKNSNRSKMMSIGRKKFNMDPKKGIEYLIEKGLLQVSFKNIYNRFSCYPLCKEKSFRIATFFKIC